MKVVYCDWCDKPMSESMTGWILAHVIGEGDDNVEKLDFCSPRCAFLHFYGEYRNDLGIPEDASEEVAAQTVHDALNAERREERPA